MRKALRREVVPLERGALQMEERSSRCSPPVASGSRLAPHGIGQKGGLGTGDGFLGKEGGQPLGMGIEIGAAIPPLCGVLQEARVLVAGRPIPMMLTVTLARTISATKSL